MESEALYSKVKSGKIAGLLFISLFGIYLALSPGAVGGRGYVQEEVDSGTQMLISFNAWMKHRPVPPVTWSRHGPVPVLLDLPFIKIGKMIVTPDFIMSFQPVLLTAGLCTILFLWLRKLCSPGLSLLLTLSAAFGTMLWPYAYIGLETKQSLFILLAGYLGLARGKIRSGVGLISFGLVCGLSLSLKSTGITLWPAVAYLVYVQFREDWRPRWKEVLAVSGIIAFVWLVGAWTRNFYWGPLGGGYVAIRPWMIDSPLQYLTNAIGFFGSPTKGAFVYSPVVLVAIYAIPAALRRNRDATIFALLVTGCTVAFMSVMRFQTDEVWGARYFHVAIAPLLLCIGAAWARFNWKRDAFLVGLSAIGLVIAFLGAFYYYGALHSLAFDTGQNTMEWITGDPVWNEVVLSGRLFNVWWENSPTPVNWTAQHTWAWDKPPGAPVWQSVDLRKYALPQSFLIQNWHTALSDTSRSIFRLYRASLVIGLLSLIVVILLTLRERTTPW